MKPWNSLALHNPFHQKRELVTSAKSNKITCPTVNYDLHYLVGFLMFFWLTPYGRSSKKPTETNQIMFVIINQWNKYYVITKNETVSGIFASLDIKKKKTVLKIGLFWIQRAQESWFSIIFVDLAKKDVDGVCAILSRSFSPFNICEYHNSTQHKPTPTFSQELKFTISVKNKVHISCLTVIYYKK